MGDLGLDRTNVNWQAKQLDDLYQVKDGETSFGDKVQDWKDVAAEFEAIGQYIDASLKQARVVQDGAAADAQQQAMQPLAQYAEACKGYADMTANAVQEQGGHRVTAMTSLPEKMDKPSLKWYEAVTLPGLVNHELEKAQYDERTEQARKVMETYENSTNANLSSMPTFEPPPPMAFAVDVPSGGQNPTWNGDYESGSSVGSSGSTTSQPPATVNPTFTAPSQVPPGNGGHLPQPPYNGGGGGGGGNPLPTPKPPMPLPMPPTGGGGPYPKPTPAPRPNPMRPLPLPTGPTGPGAGRNTPGPAAGRGPVPNGGRGGFGPGGPGGRAGFGPGGVGGRGPGGFGPMGGGAGDLGARGGMGPGGASGVGGFGPEDNARNGAAGGGRPGASGPAGGAGGHGSRGQGGEDKEHKRPDYLVEMEDIYDDGTKVAPPVIGG
ncbi:hypothetical protein [Streptoalloteichus hindustanus]|uniref:PPE family protein n=1 Tax=Streptoalloteichus hindustanus TaxID=2017 RepID=A0A1M4VVQ4_STRHI|nr:hypothetical protein [Streptoalloteichus hindustanus]SHE72812.1 hypothetical protein SAMN05444320_101901 [Streptoalloteichus hindustanus]